MHPQWVSKPCRCLFLITPVIPNRHFIPSSLLFFIHNSQLALIGGCFQALLPPNSHRTPRLGSNNGSGDIRDPVVAKRDLAALGPLLLSGRCSGWWKGAPLPDLTQDPLDHRGVLDNSKKSHLAATLGADERAHLIDLLDQPCPGSAGSLAEPIIRFDGFRSLAPPATATRTR